MARLRVATLLPLIPDDVIKEAARRARTELYDVHGPEFSRAAFAQEAADEAARLYEEKAAADYLAAMPDEERAEWITYANSTFARKGGELSGRSAIVMPDTAHRQSSPAADLSATCATPAASTFPCAQSE